MASPIIAVEELSATPPGAPGPVLQRATLAVHAGERITLSGPSGTGKSTLLRCMVLLEPAEGRVLLDGRVVEPEGVRELRRRVAYVPQHPVAIGATVAENLAFPRSLDGSTLDASDQRRLLDRLGLADADGDRRFDALSGGERQRVALVRSLTPSPDVLLLDEPTASLDPDNVDAVVALLREWVEARPERALVWVSHHAGEVAGLATRTTTMAELTS
jgi:putative ABC transport system ATP-binding protein